MTTLLVLLLAYSIGSVPFAYLAGRLAGRDLLAEGSGGVSGTAAIERLGKVPGAIAGLADALKPALAIFIAQRLATYEVSAVAGVVAVAGHVWPFTLRFRGGRGIGPAGGALAALGSWHMALAFAGLVLGKAIIKDSAPGALIGFFATAIVLSLTGAALTLSLTGWTLLGLLVTARLVGFRKAESPDDVSTATLLWRRFLLDRDRP
ncbi:MAG: glycerol-3-phosphate acyltransferase [Chloroflexi bacterium]|nr:glycerol-3-phosphate acyltransferase [Chloroflexota bacterium]